MQIVLVCVTIFGQIWIKGEIPALLIEGKEDGSKWEGMETGGSVWDWMLMVGSGWEWMGVGGSGWQWVGVGSCEWKRMAVGESCWEHGLAQPILEDIEKHWLNW